MREYIYKDKTKYRLRLSLEKTPYKKKVKGPYISYAEQLFREAKKLKDTLLANSALFSTKMVDRRIEGVFDDEVFKKICKFGSEIRKIEVINYFCFAVSVTSAAFLCAFGGIILKNSLFYLGVIPLVLLFSFIFRTKIPFKKFYREVYLPICYNAANVVDESEGLTFEVYDKKHNWDKRFTNKRIITNRFKVFAKNVTTTVEKMLVRNNITTYSMNKGRVHIGKRLATIFSGYSFEMNFENEIGNPDDIKIAIINEDTFYGTDGLYKEDATILKLSELKRISLDKKWRIYVNEKFEFTDRDMREIRKKILLISHGLGVFNAYITGNTIRMMIGVKSNRDGFKEEKFQAQLKNPEKITYGGFYSITKTLYCIYCMKRFLKIVYGKDFVVKTRRKPVEKKEKRLIFKKNKKNLFDDTKDNKEKTKDAIKKAVLNKHADGDISIALKVVISVVIGALIYVGFVNVINNTYVNNSVSQTESVFNGSRETLTTDDLI